jgi:hypothetical protein
MKLPVTAGTVGDFRWVEFNDGVQIEDVVGHLAPRIEGLTAINVSWDSGQMPLSAITRELIGTWPKSDCQSGHYDEWYFLRGPATELGHVEAICNYAISLQEAAASSSWACSIWPPSWLVSNRNW